MLAENSYMDGNIRNRVISGDCLGRRSLAGDLNIVLRILVYVNINFSHSETDYTASGMDIFSTWKMKKHDYLFTL
jgi:hypothetical protein